MRTDLFKPGDDVVADFVNGCLPFGYFTDAMFCYQDDVPTTDLLFYKGTPTVYLVDSTVTSFREMLEAMIANERTEHLNYVPSVCVVSEEEYYAIRFRKKSCPWCHTFHTLSGRMATLHDAGEKCSPGWYGAFERWVKRIKQKARNHSKQKTLRTHRTGK